MKWAKGVLFVVGTWMVAFASGYAQSNVQFSGLAIQSGPGGKTKQAQMYVGDNQVRMEHSRDGRKTVEIYDMKNQRTLLLVPEQKIYMQRDLAPGKAGNPIVPPQDSNPCASLADAQCKKLGVDTLYGRPVSHWEMTVELEDRTLRSEHWIDDQRHMPLREVWPDGTTTEMVLQAKETLNGRPTERWQQTITEADGKTHITKQWYDPQLRIAVREEMPGGYFREIRDIRIGPQPPGLFEIPPGYQRVENDRQSTPSVVAPNPTDGR
jgi:hypothetical protein